MVNCKFKLTVHHSYTHHFFFPAEWHLFVQSEGLCAKKTQKYIKLMLNFLIKTQINWYVFVLISQGTANIKTHRCCRCGNYPMFQNLPHAGQDFEKCWAPMPDFKVPENAEHFPLWKPGSYNSLPQTPNTQQELWECLKWVQAPTSYPIKSYFYTLGITFSSFWCQRAHRIWPSCMMVFTDKNLKRR